MLLILQEREHELGKEVDIYSLGTWEAAGGHPWLQGEFEVSLGYMIL